MNRNLFLTAIRSLAKNKFFSLLNLCGLALGMAVFFLISQYVTFEASYENFIPDAGNIYRVSLTSYVNNELSIASAENYPGVAPAMKNEFPEVVSYARLYNLGYKNNVIITYEDAKPDPVAFKHRRFLYADSAFLPMMGYSMFSGDAQTALAQPSTAVISRAYARQYFGDDEAIGKMLRMLDDDYNDELVKITGVFNDLPDNTHLKFDILFSYRTLFTRRPDRGSWAVSRYDQSWQRQDMYTFVELAPGTDPKIVERKFPALIAKHNPGLAERGQRDVFQLQPLKNIHLTSNLAEEPESNGDKKIVFFLGLIGIFVLVIAWINYINLSTAKAIERAKEVGIRKVMGALKFQLVTQFLLEAAFLNMFSLLIAFILAVLVLPYFNSLAGVSFSIANFLQPWFLTMMLILFLTGTFISGFYPALILSSFKPVTVLKGKFRTSSRGVVMRKVLVVAQFSASIALIAGTLIVYRQLDYMMKADLGMDISRIFVVERPGIAPRDRNAFNSSIDVFRNEVKKDPSIVGVCTSVTIPGKQREYKGLVKKYGAPDDQKVTVRFNSMDYDFISVYKMRLVAGRNFSPDHTNDPDTSVIITESAAKLLGYKNAEDAIGQTITAPEWQFTPIVVGVVNDYHQVSLKKAVDPTIFYCSPYYGEFYSIRLHSSNLSQSISHVKESWEKAFPGNPFDFFFLDDYFNNQYKNERKFQTVFTTFAVLAVIVGCLGLFGLSAYTTSQRTKEIGLRKALGSSERKIFILLSKEYLKLAMFAMALATPLSWLVMKSWVEGFSYRTPISPLIFIVAGLFVLLVTLATVTFQTLRAARTNPVDALRYE